MSWDQYVYHLTGSKFKPEKLQPWSHVGSLRAAMGIGRDEWKRGNRPFLHAYKLAPKGKGVEITDHGGDSWDQIDDIIYQLIKKKVIPEPRGYKWKPKPYHGGEDEYYWDDWPDYERVTEKWDDEMKMNYMQKYLEKKGITHLYYKNAVEDPGSRSFIIFRPEKTLKPVHTFKGPFKYTRRFTKFTDSLGSMFVTSKRKTKFPIQGSPTTGEFPYKYAAEKKKQGRYWNTKEAQRLKAKGWTYRALGKRYGVTGSAVWFALNAG